MIELKIRGLDLVIWLSAHAAIEELLCSVRISWCVIPDGLFDFTQLRTFIYLIMCTTASLVMFVKTQQHFQLFRRK